MKHLDLFSGIGGFALAAESVWGTEYENVGFCDNEPFSQAILRKHWPKSLIYDDIKKLLTPPPQPTLSLEVFPASHSVPLGSVEARKTTAISGRKCLESYGHLLPAGSSVRMLADFLLGTEDWYSTKCVLTWKLRVTKSGRSLFQLAPSTPRTEGIGFGLLLTPTVVQTEETPEKMRARAERAGYRNGTKWGSLASQVRFMLPTPTATDYKSRGPNSKQVGIDNLMKLVPTPTARDSRGTGKVGHKSRDSVDYLVEKGTRKGEIVGKGTGLKLQPSFALWMMGYQTDHLDLKDGEMPLSKGRGTPSSRKLPQ